MAVQRDQAILVGHRPGGAKGRILSFITGEAGLLHLYYRRFPQRVRLEFLDALQAGELLYSPAAENAPGRIQAFHRQEVWPAVREDFQRLVHALHFAEMACLVSSEGEPAPGTYRLLHLFLSLLEKGGAPRTLRIIFELRLLREAGFAPSMTRCSTCHDPVPAQEVSFAVRGTGIVCPSCLRTKRMPVRRLSPGSVTVMGRALSMPLDRISRLKIGPELGEEIQQLLDDIMTEVHDRVPPSVDFLRKVGRRCTYRKRGPAGKAAKSL